MANCLMISCDKPEIEPSRRLEAPQVADLPVPRDQRDRTLEVEPLPGAARSVLSCDTQVGPLTVNAARSATVPAELAQFLNIMRREQPISLAVADGMADAVDVQHDCGPTSMTVSRLIICH
jgi:hypothetical protein